MSLQVQNPSKTVYTILSKTYAANGDVTINYTFVNPQTNQVTPQSITIPAAQTATMLACDKAGIEATFYEGMLLGM